MEALRVILTRRAVRVFEQRQVPAADIEAIVEAGRRAPSSMNEQRWDFIVCTDKEHLAALSKVGDYADHIAGSAFAVALVNPEADEVWRRESMAFDLGQAAENMMVAAWAMEIGSVHGSVYDEPMARELLGYPEGYRCDTIISFGYPADPGVFQLPPSEGRKPAEEVVHRERWGHR